MRPALIHNPNSRRNQYDGARFAVFAKQELGEFSVSCQHDEHLPDYVRTLAEQGVDTIAINGGDGTVSACMTAIEAAYPADKLPTLAILPSGNTNLIAGDVGFGLRGPAAIERLLSGKPFSTSERAPIRLSWSEKSHSSVLGMFGGCTGYARAVRIAHSPTVLRFAPHDLAVIFTVVTSIASLLFARSRNSWMSGNRLHWQASRTQGTVTRDGRSFLFIATALEKLSRGVWPFWGGQNQEGFHFLDVDSFPKKLPSALFHLLRGSVPGWLRQHSDYMSGRTLRMELETDSDFVLDGEVFSAPSEERLILERGPVFRFLHA